jgi:hypothetical protein
MTDVSLTLSEAQLAELEAVLFPGDELEAAAVVLCGRHEHGGRHRLVGHRVVPVPNNQYERREHDLVIWKTGFLQPLLIEATKKGMAILKVHSHPSGYAAFSATDDAADAALFPSIYGWLHDGLPHASAILLPCSKLIGRAHVEGGAHEPLSSTTIIGADIRISRQLETAVSAAGERNAQVFGNGTYSTLRALRAAVVGTSGTGSWVVDLLSKLEVGHLALVDPEHVEEKNLNRIDGATAADVGRLKVEVLRDRIESLGLGTEVDIIPHELSHPDAIAAVAGVDVVFGCVDSIDGRHLLNRLATFYALPYFDIGVRLIADGGGGVDQVCGTVHYLQPGLSSLLTRGLYTREQLRAANLKRAEPEAFAAEHQENYIAGVDVGRPAVAPVNMFYSAAAVLDFLARLHPFRLEDNAEIASLMWSHSGLFQIRKAESDYEVDAALAKCVGRGDANPPLGLPMLSPKKEST